MINLSMVQALSVWSDLVSAYHQRNGYGGNVAEIYAYRLQPALIVSEIRHDVERQAARSLRSLVRHFEKAHDARVYIEMDASTWARAIHALKGAVIQHRVHLRVVHAKPKAKP